MNRKENSSNFISPYNIKLLLTTREIKQAPSKHSGYGRKVQYTTKANSKNSRKKLILI